MASNSLNTLLQELEAEGSKNGLPDLATTQVLGEVTALIISGVIGTKDQRSAFIRILEQVTPRNTVMEKLNSHLNDMESFVNPKADRNSTHSEMVSAINYLTTLYNRRREREKADTQPT